jgi:hypothetical protein
MDSFEVGLLVVELGTLAVVLLILRQVIGKKAKEIQK